MANSRESRRFTDQLKVKLGILTTLMGILGTIIFYTYVFAVDQTKKDFQIESNKQAIMQIREDVRAIRDKVISIDENVLKIVDAKLHKKPRRYRKKKQIEKSGGKQKDERLVLRKQ